MTTITENRISQMFKVNPDFIPDFLTEAKQLKPKSTVWYTDPDGELKEVMIVSYDSKAKSYVIDMSGNELVVSPSELNESFMTEAVPANPDDAIRNMFTSKMFKGVVPNKDLMVIFKKGNQWDKLFGIDKVKRAWKELVDDKFVIKTGDNWKWAG